MKQEYISIGVAAGMLAVFSALSAMRGHLERAEGFLLVSAALLVAGIASLKFRIHFHRWWTRTIHAIGFVNGTIILGAVFWIGFGFYRVWGRLLGRDPLGRRTRSGNSYWISRQRTRQQPWQFERLY
ncbi:MAG: SxtJ family membrane protein [Bryobacteraceae bacterium]